VSDAARADLLAAATRALEGYQVAGALRFPIAAHLVSSRK